MISTIADAINDAINEHLWNGNGAPIFSKMHCFSCDAVKKSLKNDDLLEANVEHFFSSLGCNVYSLSMFGELCYGPKRQYALSMFDELCYGPKRQYARALWLTWAAMIAGEEGL